MTCLEKFNKDVKEIVNLCSTLGVTEVHAGCKYSSLEGKVILMVLEAKMTLKMFL